MTDFPSEAGSGGPVIVIMGVTGSGKTTIGQLLAQRLGLQFHDADDFHPPDNREKLAADVPLNDADREPWLNELQNCIARWGRTSGAVLACSALKHSYRKQLRAAANDVRFVFLHGNPNLIADRVAERSLSEEHVVKQFALILEGQFRDLEVPTDAVRVDVNQTPEQIVEQILAAFDTDPRYTGADRSHK